MYKTGGNGINAVYRVETGPALSHYSIAPITRLPDYPNTKERTQMSEKFKNKYRTQSSRAQWWNYSNAGAYFITICTAYREPYFGYIETGKIHLSAVGKIADSHWYDIVNHSIGIKLGDFVVMPNHIHGIVINQKSSGINETNFYYRIDSSAGKNRLRNPGKNTISSIIGGYKSAVSRKCNSLSLDFVWHSRFHDHIIRDHAEFQRISTYIKSNPLNWANDKFFQDAILM